MRRFTPPAQSQAVMVDFEGTSVEAIDGEPLACALLASGQRVFSRSPKYHRPRGPFCFTRSCGQCLMRVDGVPNVFTCEAPARAGTRVERQNAYPTADFDLLNAVDWLFPKGFDPHTLLARTPWADRFLARVVAPLAGVGELPDAPAPHRPPMTVIHTDVLLVGGGDAGLAAAAELAHPHFRCILVEKEPWLGGHRVNAQIARPAAMPASPVEVWTRAVALAVYEDVGGRFVLVARGGSERPFLVKAYTKHLVLAPGGYAAPLTFQNNDRPGVFSVRAAARLLFRHQIRCTYTPALVGQGPELYAMAKHLVAVGIRPALVLDTQHAPPAGTPRPAHVGRPIRVHGASAVSGLSFLTSRGRRDRVDCDTVLVAGPISPAFELARQAGAALLHTPLGFRVDCDEEGRTSIPGVWATGTAAGAEDAEASTESGFLTGHAVGNMLRGGTRA
ncbi:MAG: 2Fe-2S iron-sulfur cluster-binding protein [Myxococcaceae bacterium]